MKDMTGAAASALLAFIGYLLVGNFFPKKDGNGQKNTQKPLTGGSNVGNELPNIDNGAADAGPIDSAEGDPELVPPARQEQPQEPEID